MFFLKQVPTLHVLIPLIGALFSILVTTRAAYFIATVCALACSALSLVSCFYQHIPFSYVFGDWHPFIGIEYKIDNINQPVILYVHSVLTFLLLFNKNLIKTTILNTIKLKKQNLFFSLLLFAHVGFIGMISTNDIFNLYVFIEISSLASYVLLATGKKSFAAIGAFDYLILGTIGATLILLGIGFLLAITGSLNMTHIMELSAESYHLKTMLAAIVFLIIGSLLKLAFFPLHFWMVRAYNNAPLVLLIYLSSISGIIGSYVLMRLTSFTLDYKMITKSFWLFFRYLSLASLILCPLLAFYSKSMRKIIIYSAATQMAYVILLIFHQAKWNLILKFLIADGINKIALFIIASSLETIEDDQQIKYYNSEISLPAPVLMRGYSAFKKQELGRFFAILASLNIIASASLPISSMFLVKIDILSFLFQNNLWQDAAMILIASSIALLYHYNIVKKIFFSGLLSKTLGIKNTALIAITLIQFIYIGIITCA